VWTGRIRTDEASLDAPKQWLKPRRVFVNSMSDLFHDDVPASFIARGRSTWRTTLTVSPNRRANSVSLSLFSDVDVPVVDDGLANQVR